MDVPFSLPQILIGVLWMFAVMGIFWYCAKAAVNITYVTLADGRRQERSLPISFRLLLPWSHNFLSMFAKPGFEKSRNKINSKIIASAAGTSRRRIHLQAE